LSRYNAGTGIEGEYEPGSRRKVLKNLLGITSKMEMDRVELDALQAAQDRYYDSEAVTAKTGITADLLKQMHRDWLGGIYEWAGSYRTVDMSKGGFVFPPAFLVEANMERFEREALAAHTPLRPGPLPDVCRSLAEVHAELLLIHPFREGNGRLARWLAELMAAQVGLPAPEYGFVGSGSRRMRQVYLRAVQLGYRQDYAELESFFERALRAGLAVERKARGEAPSKTEDS